MRLSLGTLRSGVFLFNSILQSLLSPRVKRWVLPIAAGLVLVLATTGCAVQPPTSSATPDALVLRGRDVFIQKGCFQSCHGAGALAAAQGRHDIPNRPGPMPPDLVTSPVRSDDWLRAYLLSPQSLLPYSPMASYNDLSDADLKALIAYLQSIKTTAPPSKVPLVDPGIIPVVLPNVNTYKTGRAVYQTYCRGCHGEDGNGKGVAGHLLLPEPRDFTDAAWWSKQSTVYLFSVVSYGKPSTAMPPFNEILTMQERAQVLNYIGYFSDPVAKQRMELPTAAGLEAP